MVPEAAAMAVMLRDLGVTQKIMLLEEESLNTRDNVEKFREVPGGWY